MKRRQLLKQTGLATAGMGALAATPMNARANDWEGGYVHTRDYYDCSPERIGDTEAYDTWSVPCFDKGCVDDMTVAIHGFSNDHGEATNMFDEAGAELVGEGYTGEIVGWSWKADCTHWNPQHEFNIAEDIAWWEGKRLAKFIIDWKSLNPDGELRLLSHSLGAQVIFSGLHHLRYYYAEYDELVTSVHMLGAAAPAPWPDDSDFEFALQYNTVATYNYINDDDGTLDWYERHDDKPDFALGKYGARNGSPCDFYDRDYSWAWGSEHGFDYYMSNCAYGVYSDMMDAYIDDC